MTLHHLRILSSIAALSAFTLTCVVPVQACTSLLLETAGGDHVYGRTMEFGFDLASDGTVIPRQHAYQSEIKDGAKWVSKYGVVGMNVFGMPYVCDGMNEKGLTGGILYFPDYAGYTQPAEAEAGKGLAPWEFLTWALSQFSTVEEVKGALDSIQVVEMKMPHLGVVPPFHFTLHDASGHSIVVEPVDGKLKVYDNPYGVLTNSPTFDWHLTNLKNYVKLTPENVPPMKVAGQTVPSFGQGSGWLGIPGDPTPPSRLIRALAFSMTTDLRPSGIESVRLVEHIMNNFDIPYGTIKAKGEEHLDYTQWTAIADIAAGTYYVKTYTNQRLHSIDLADFDLDAVGIKTASIPEDLSATTLFKGK